MKEVVFERRFSLGNQWQTNVALLEPTDRKTDEACNVIGVVLNPLLSFRVQSTADLPEIQSIEPYGTYRSFFPIGNTVFSLYFVTT